MLEPLENLQVTGAFQNTYDNAKGQSKYILQFFGIPGSGKSQLVRFLAKKFPYTATAAASDESNLSPLFIKWHIQCKDTRDDLNSELLKLAEKLQEESFVKKDTSLKSTLEENFKKCSAIQFLKLLLECRPKVPILIIVEDPPETARNLLQHFFQSLNQCFRSTVHTAFHIYVTSRSKSAIITKGMPQIDCHKTVNIKGFSKEEAIRFLEGESSDERDLVEIYNRCSGLPLGLLAAKGYCQSTGWSYNEYLHLVNNSERTYDILEREKEAILTEYGKSVEHIFPAIVMIFFDATPEAANTLGKILSCVSYFHYDHIPRYLLEYCCHIVSERKMKNVKQSKADAELRTISLTNKADVGLLTNKLLENGMGTKTSDGAITFHEVVQNAFRLKQQPMEDFNPLKKATEAICGLVSLDLRRKKNSIRMNQLLPHMQALLHHLDKNLETLENDNDFEILKAVASLLYQAVGALLLGDSKEDESDAMFRKSLEMIWPEMVDVALLQTTDPEELARKIIEKSTKKAQSLPRDFIIKYSSWIMLSHFDDDEVAFLNEESQGNFENVKNLVNPLASRTLLIEELQKRKLFLLDEEFRPIFFAERFASILHSWSRCFLFRDHDPEIEQKCLRMYTLSKSVSDCAYKSSITEPGIRLLTQWLSQIAGLIPFLLRQEDKPEHLRKALKLCEEMISNEKLKMYEKGSLKRAFDPPMITRSSLLRYIVRINARLIKSSEQSVAQLQQADEKCLQLFQLITGNAEVLSNYIGFIIYCAKYYAAKTDFAQAMKCFKEFFERTSNQKLKPKLSTEFWATYNYARAVNVHGKASSHDKLEAIQRCKIILSSDKISQIQDDLKQKLIKVLEKLQSSKNS